MNTIYRWSLDFDTTVVDVHPIYKDDLSLDYALEQGQKFFRAKLSGKITLVGVDADYIINAPFYTEFKLYILKSLNGISWSIYYECHFFKTDCTINEDDRKIEVQPSVLDNYNDILNGLEKEYNILEMPLAVQPITATKRPMLQIYEDGEDIISCISGGNSFETDRINDDVSPTDCHFSASNKLWKIHFPNNQIFGLDDDFLGMFRGFNQTEPFDRFYNDEYYYYIEYFEYADYTDPDWNYYYNGLRIKNIQNNATIWEFEQYDTSGWINIPNTITFTKLSDQSTLTAEKTENNIYARLVCDVTEVLDQQQQTKQTYRINNNDIAANNRNYQYCIGVVISRIYQSDRLSTTPTKWGRADNGYYFLPPDDLNPYIPVARSKWGNTSLWIHIPSFLAWYDEHAAKQYTIKDTYPIATVINTLLSKVAPNITFNETAACSQFFYDDTIAGGVASRLNGTRPFISPKSNILLGEYKEPAQKAPITLKTVFDMLAKVYGCYWYIKPDNTLVIEHISWFKNGGRYSGSPAIGFDLTSLENIPNGKKWAFATSQYQFDKLDMPARYQYEWMDEVSDMFKGNPINVLSKFVTENKVEEINIANFSSDIDLMLLAAEKFSKDGFALLQAQSVSGGYILPFNTYSDGVYQYTLQNYMVSMRFLQPNFLTYDMPSWSIELNNIATTAAGIQRSKKQTITFPVGNDDPDMNKLVKTYIGNGQFDKLSINLSSRAAKATLKYNTYDN